MGVIIRSTQTVYGLDTALSNLNTVITTEATTRATNDTALQTAITTEATTRATNDTALQTNLTTEATTRATNDTALQTAITGEETARITAVTAEAAARTSADTALGGRIDALGNAFNYVGTVTGGVDAANAYDMATSATGTKDAGDYYKVTTSGWFKVDTDAAFHANLNDGLVWNLASNIDKIDNTDSNVAGTTDFITVTGSTETGFTVDVATTLKTRVTTLETGLASGTGALTTALAATNAALAAEVTNRTAADTALDTSLKAYAVEAARLGGSRQIVENIIVSSNKIVLTNAPKDGAFSIGNYMTCRYTDSTTNEAWDYPVIVDGTDPSGKTLIISVNTSGQLNTKTVSVQYTYVNAA